MSGIKEELVRGLTPRSLVISVSLLIISIIIGDIQWLYSEKPWVFHGWFVPFVYIILINEVLGRINKRLRLTSQELLVIFPSMFFAAGKNYVLAGITAGEIIFSELHWNLELTAFALNIGDLRDVFAELTPWFMFPTGPEGMEIARIIQEGLKPGEALNWGLLTVPILYWSAVMVLMFFIMQFLVFAIVGQPWTEVERLVFPMAVPYMYTINRAGDVDPATNKSRLFDLKDPRMKVFWAGLIVGILLTAIPALYEVFPPLAILEAFQWGETPVRFEPLVAALPGARGWACLIIAQALLWLLLPNEVYYTSIAMWIVFGVLYQWLGVMTGVIAYEPGMEYRWPWEAVPQWWAPLPYGLIATTGIMLGIGAWNLWFLRSRIKRLASVFKGGEDIVEHGLSMRFMTRFGVASILLFLILMVVTGVPVVIAVIFLALWFLWLVQVTRCWSEIWWHEGNFAVQGNIWNYYHNIGAAMGYWPMEATWEVPNMSYAWYATNRITFATSTWVVRHYPMGEGNLALLYKMAHYNKLDLKDLFTITLIIGVVGSVFATIWQIWMLAHGGGAAATNAWSWTPWLPAGAYFKGTGMLHPVQTPSPGAGAVASWVALIVGLIAISAIYLLRMRFAWFWVNPTVAVMLWLPGYVWLAGLIAWVVKSVSIRAVGLKRYEEYILPAAAGAVIGFGIPYLFAAGIHFFTVSLPKFLALYTP